MFAYCGCLLMGFVEIFPIRSFTSMVCRNFNLPQLQFAATSPVTWYGPFDQLRVSCGLRGNRSPKWQRSSACLRQNKIQTFSSRQDETFDRLTDPKSLSIHCRCLTLSFGAHKTSSSKRFPMLFARSKKKSKILLKELFMLSRFSGLNLRSRSTSRKASQSRQRKRPTPPV